MSVQDPHTIDFVSLGSEPNTALLVVSDHLEWASTLEHEFALQEKLNAYLSFIESGEIYARFPKAKGKRIEIRIFLQHAPDEKGVDFLRKVKGVVESAGFHLTYQVGVNTMAPDRMN